MKEKRIKRMADTFSKFFIVSGSACVTVLCLELVFDKGENTAVLYLSVIAAALFSIAAVILDGVVDYCEMQETRKKSQAYQAWQKWQLWVEDKRMRMNINVK